VAVLNEGLDPEADHTKNKNILQDLREQDEEYT
jgi:hypothetical protein